MEAVELAEFNKKVNQRNKAQGKKNFIAGMAYEFVVLKKERKKALFAIRSAGSHTLIDIVAVRSNETRLISIRKNGTWLEKELEELITLQNSLPDNHNVYLAYNDKTMAKKYQIVRLNEV